MGEDKKLIYFLVAIIIFVSIILLIKIKTTEKYDQKIYEEVYNEYENIFENNAIQENQNSRENLNIINYNIGDNTTSEKKYNESTSTTYENVIGKIIIPKIDIKYPIIKETTKEYLKVAPTKYCGPEINEVRKFGYSRTQL